MPNYARGRDDIWNGIALCRLHHWAFDVGWFTLNEDFHVQISEAINRLPTDHGMVGNYDFLRTPVQQPTALFLPVREHLRPDTAAIRWHSQNIFNRG